VNFFDSMWGPRRESRAVTDKAWNRSKSIAWDDKWYALGIPARRAYLTQIKAPTRQGSMSQQGTLVDKVPAEAVKQLLDAGFIKVEEGIGKRSAKIVPLSTAYDFSARLRGMHRYGLLSASHRDDLMKYCRHVFPDNGEGVMNRVLGAVAIQERVRMDEGLEDYVTSGDWPDWALKATKAKAAEPLLAALRKATGPVPKAVLASLVPSHKPAEVEEALSELVENLAVFEDVKAETFEILVGFLPIVRTRLVDANKPQVRPPLVVVENPKDIGPPGGLAVNDLRIFLLEVAQDPPRLRQDGGIFAKEEPRFLGAFLPHPGWLDAILGTSIERRFHEARNHARFFKFVETETEENASWLRLTGKGRVWLSSGLEEQYAKLYHELRDPAKKTDPYSYDYNTGDSRFLGISVTVATPPKGQTYYYPSSNQRPEDRDRVREALRKSLETLPVGVFHRWDSVLEHLSFGDENPLSRSVEGPNSLIFLDQRTIPRLPARLTASAKLVIDGMMRVRLLPFDAFQPAIDAEGRLCVARLPRLAGYFGRPYEAGESLSTAPTRVIVQPDFSLMVIGLDPAPAAELAPFCERSSGHAGQGVLTFKITRDSVLRAATQGLSGGAIAARLKKHASVDVPENVIREVQEWANWVRLVNVRTMTVVRCPDSETVARVISTLGKKAERLNDSLVALNAPKLTPAERQKLQEQGITVTKDDITFRPTASTPSASPSPSPSATPSDPTAPTPKKRGRPKKAR
jgi:hypothetical protein